MASTAWIGTRESDTWRTVQERLKPNAKFGMHFIKLRAKDAWMRTVLFGKLTTEL